VLAGSTDTLKTLGETGTGMPGVMPASMSRSLNINTQSEGLELGMERNIAMTTSMTMQGSTNSLNSAPQQRPRYTHRNATSQNWFTFDDDDSSTGRADLAAKEKEREERIRKMREMQEQQRKKKLEELKQNALQAQKFRELQELERRKHIEDLRTRDMDRRQQVEERRREIERAESERRGAILAKNKERAKRIESARRHSRGNLELAFGSSAPRLVEAHRDSSSWAQRSTYDRRSSERELDFKTKRTTSAQALDRNPEGDDCNSLHAAAATPQTAHRRRTDLIPTLLHGGAGSTGLLSGSSRHRSGANTPGSTPTYAPPGGLITPRAVSASRIDQLARPKQSKVFAAAPHGSNGGAANNNCNGMFGTASSKSMVTLAALSAPTKTGWLPKSHAATTGHSGVPVNLGAQKSTSTHGLSTGGTMKRQRAVTSGTAKAKSLSRENSTTTSRPSSAMSGGGAHRMGQSQVRMRPHTAGRRPRPLSIATTGMSSSMTSSMYEERQKPFHRNRTSATPKLDRTKRARSINGENIEDDQRSTGSSTGCGPVNSAPVRPSSARKTPAQVKAENAARRAKMTGRPKSDVMTSSVTSLTAPDKPNSAAASVGAASGSVGAAGDTASADEDGAGAGSERQITPDIIKGQDSSKSECDDAEGEVTNEVSAELTQQNKANNNNIDKDGSVEREDRPAGTERKIITSEQEAKARIAEKRKEMKEKMEREAEIERLRLEAEAKAEEERRRAEEEEERRMIEETERLAAEAKKVEEERIQKAMEEAAERARIEKEEEDRLRAEKEEAEKKAKEEADKREKELQELEEKRRIEEEERLLRKKRVEAIMARTRGKGTPGGTPKKEVDGKEEGEEEKGEEESSQPASLQPPSLDNNVDPTKPDLLGHINDQQPAEPLAKGPEEGANQGASDNSSEHTMQNGDSSENNQNVIQNGSAVANINEGGEEDYCEKGALDSLSNKSEDSSESNKISSNHSPLIQVEAAKISALESDFDQILDLSGDTNKGSGSEAQAPQPPIIAFEANQPQADLLS